MFVHQHWTFNIQMHSNSHMYMSSPFPLFLDRPLAVIINSMRLIQQYEGYDAARYEDTTIQIRFEGRMIGG
jgi:hypothetical protein